MTITMSECIPYKSHPASTRPRSKVLLQRNDKCFKGRVKKTIYFVVVALRCILVLSSKYTFFMLYYYYSYNYNQQQRERNDKERRFKERWGCDKTKEFLLELLLFLLLIRRFTQLIHQQIHKHFYQVRREIFELLIVFMFMVGDE